MTVQANAYAEEALQLLRDSTEKMRPFEKESLELSREAPEKAQHFSEEAHAFKKEAEETLKETLIPKNSGSTVASCQTNNPGAEQNTNEYLIFVSLSMPRETLKSLYKEAEANRAVLILRGLKEQSFRKTGEYIKELEIGLQINPDLFKKYHIQNLPTFIRIKGDEHDSLSGNVSLQFAKQKFLEANL